MQSKYYINVIYWDDQDSHAIKFVPIPMVGPQRCGKTPAQCRKSVPPDEHGEQWNSRPNGLASFARFASWPQDGNTGSGDQDSGVHRRGRKRARARARDHAGGEAYIDVLSAGEAGTHFQTCNLQLRLVFRCPAVRGSRWRPTARPCAQHPQGRADPPRPRTQAEWFHNRVAGGIFYGCLPFQRFPAQIGTCQAGRRELPCRILGARPQTTLTGETKSKHRGHVGRQI